MNATGSKLMGLSVVVVMTALFLYPGLASAGTYRLTVAGERLEFVPRSEKGYVIKLAEKTGGIRVLARISALDAKDATPIGGIDRHGVWTVENEGPATRNEETIRSLRASSRVAYAAPLFSSNGETVAIIPEIVIRVKPRTDSARVEALCEKGGCRIKKRMEFTEQEYLLEVLGSDAEAVLTAVEQLSQAPEVEWASLNTAFRPKLSALVVPADHTPAGQVRIASAGGDPNNPGVFPNDEYFPLQWHLHNTGQFGAMRGADIRAPEAWEITTGDPNIVIAVLDTGVDSSHPDLMHNLVAGYDFYSGDDDPNPALDYPFNVHGTACAGLIAAQGNNTIGVTGVTWNCRIMPIRCGGYSATGGGYTATVADSATALRWAAAQGADILSNSWIGYSSDQPIIHSAVIDITVPGGLGRDGKGCVALWSSGNDSAPIKWYPQKYPEVISVGATDHNDVRWSYSSYGPELDIVAPGGERWYYGEGEGKWSNEGNMLWTTDITGLPGMSSHPKNPYTDILDYAPIGGTSSSCPVAAGVAALILSIEPNLTGDEVRYFLERSAKDLGDPGRDDYYGWGRVDARAALDMVLAYRCDLNKDWRVDDQDLAILNAAIEANDLSADIAPAKKRDGKVDQQDLDLLTRYLGTVIPELGLIAYWKLDETEGTIAHNAAGVPAYNATVMGLPLWQPDGGKVGGALQFSGPPTFATAKCVRDPSEGPFSVFAWVKDGGAGQVIVSQAKGVNWLMAGVGTGAMATDLKESGRTGKSLASTSVVTDGNWHRVGFVWDGKNRILYVDGVEVARDTQASLPSWAGGLYIGTGSTMTPASFWKGLIDDVRVYNRAVKP